jgi:hypothetical protein
MSSLWFAEGDHEGANPVNSTPPAVAHLGESNPESSPESTSKPASGASGPARASAPHPVDRASDQSGYQLPKLTAITLYAGLLTER